MPMPPAAPCRTWSRSRRWSCPVQALRLAALASPVPSLTNLATRSPSDIGKHEHGVEPRDVRKYPFGDRAARRLRSPAGRLSPWWSLAAWAGWRACCGSWTGLCRGPRWHG